MSDNQQDGQPEPTMEEILSSIRRIISDDDQPSDAPAAAKAAAPAPKAAAPAESDPFDDIDIEAEAESEPEPAEEDVLELTQVVNEDGSVTGIDEIVEEAEADAEPEPEPAFEDDFVAAQSPGESIPPAPSEPPIMGDAAAHLAAAALNQLVVEMPKFIGIGQGLTLEEITKELLRPMLKQWLDAYLPGTVERLVQEEIALVSRLHR
ncbi:MAG: DUF2497 domain-containing protein [Alphaproteobacteria bacterium]|nr:DUF2497 domain-containing protein [Alphaproteobacteria bacterium]